MSDYENNENNGFGYLGYNDNSAMNQTENVEDANNLSGIAKIKVIGVGGAGNNAVNRLIESGLKNADFIVVNTDNQVLALSKATHRIQIGVKLTKGLGAGADPSVGKASAEENKEELQSVIKGTDLLFITAGMGGGTGTGAAPVVAKIAKDMKILTIAVVTLPFSFEGKRKMDYALAGIEELRKSVDSIIVIPNDKISDVVPKGTSFSDSLKVADEVLRQGIRGIAELVINPSLINLDFADVRTTLKGRGLAHMGIGVAKGEKRISDAVRCAVCSPLLNTTIEGASSVILNIVGGKDLALDEVRMAADLVKGVIDYSANVIFGACIDETMSDEVEVVIIATGFPVEGQTITGTEDKVVAARKATVLSNRIDRAYGGIVEGNAPQQPAASDPRQYYNVQNSQNYQQPSQAPQYGGTNYNPNTYSQQPQAAPYSQQPQQAPSYYEPSQYSQPAPSYQQPQQSPSYNQPVEQNSFEPGDPIPQPNQPDDQSGDKKHRPKFVDYFIRRNSDNK